MGIYHRRCVSCPLLVIHSKFNSYRSPLGHPLRAPPPLRTYNPHPHLVPFESSITGYLGQGFLFLIKVVVLLGVMTVVVVYVRERRERKEKERQEAVYEYELTGEDENEDEDGHVSRRLEV